MFFPSPQLSALPGKYTGVGAWIDIAGESKPYRINQTIVLADNILTLEYTHDFFEEGTSISGVFLFERQGDCLFRVSMKDSPVGNGYMFGGYLHYYIKVGDIFVQASYQVSSAGMHVNGSSTSNVKGRFIAWHESLEKQTEA